MIDIKKSADLARINLSEAELNRFAGELNDVLNHFKALQNVNTENIEPLVTPTEITERWREDISQPGLDTELALSAAPERVGQLFKVPPVI